LAPDRQARAVATLFLAAGATVNAFLLLRGDDYATFADGSYLPFVRDTWRSRVVPNHHLFIGLLIAFELAVGVLALLGGTRTLLSYTAAIAFHGGLLFFGWGFYLWSGPMVGALTALWQGERGQLEPDRRASRDAVPPLAKVA
jgi:hypothetical protein